MTEHPNSSQANLFSARGKVSGFSRTLVIWTVLPLLVWNGLFIALWMAGWQVQKENGPMENLHASFLLAGCCILAVRTARSAGETRILCAGLSLFYLTFLINEMEVKHFGMPLLLALLDGWGRNLWMGTLWILAAVWFARNRVRTWRLFRNWLPTPAGILLMIAGVVWAFSTVGEKMHLIQPRARGLFVEELLETNGCWLMLVSAVLVWLNPPADFD